MAEDDANDKQPSFGERLVRRSLEMATGQKPSKPEISKDLLLEIQKWQSPGERSARMKEAQLVHTQNMEQRGQILDFAGLVISAATLAGLAFMFREKATAQVMVLLVGLVALFLLWPLYKKLKGLKRVAFSFDDTGVKLGASSEEDDAVAQKQREVSLKRLDIEIERLEIERLSLEAEKAEQTKSPLYLPGDTADSRSVESIE